MGKIETQDLSAGDFRDPVEKSKLVTGKGL